MSDELNNKEKAIRTILTGMSFDPGSTDDIWAKLEGNLPPEPKRKRRLVPFWWLGSLLLLVMGSIAVSSYLNSMDYKEQLATVQEQTEVTNLDSKDKKDEPLSTEAEALSIEKSQPKQNVEGPEEITRGSQTSAAGTADRVVNQRKVTTEIIESNIEKQSIPQAKALTEITTEAAIDSKQKRDNGKIAERTQTNIESSQKYFPNNKILFSKKQSESTTDQVQVYKEKDTEDFVERTIQNNTLMPTLAQQVFTQEGEELYPEIVKPVRNDIASSFFVRAKGGVVLPNFASSTSLSSTDFDATVFDREENMAGSTLGIDIGTYIGRWKVFAGLQHTDLIARYTRSDVEVQDGTVSGTEFIIIDDNGNSSLVDGTLGQTTTIDHDVVWHRRHSLLDITAGIGTDVWSWGPVSFGVEAGLGYNISTSHSGYYFSNNENAFTKFNQGEANPYRKSMGVSAALSTPISLNLGQVAIGVIPSWRLQSNPVTNTNNFYETKNSQIGVQFSIAYLPRWE